MPYVTTGRGEVALVNVPPVHSFAPAQQSQVPTTLFVSNGHPPIKHFYMPMHSQYKPPAQAWSATPDTQAENVSTERSSRTCERFFRDLFRILFGLLVCAVPLAVVSTLYGQQQVNSSSTSTSTTVVVVGNVSVTNLTLPDQCSSYTINSDNTRNVASGTGSSCDSTLVRGWYRFMGGAGTRLATSAVSINFCTTANTGYYNGTLPTTVGSTTFGALCVNYLGYTCYAPLSGSLIAVTNCNGYYVYYLLPMVSCASRYCTTA